MTLVFNVFFLRISTKYEKADMFCVDGDYIIIATSV